MFRNSSTQDLGIDIFAFVYLSIASSISFARLASCIYRGSIPMGGGCIFLSSMTFLLYGSRLKRAKKSPWFCQALMVYPLYPTEMLSGLKCACIPWLSFCTKPLRRNTAAITYTVYSQIIPTIFAMHNFDRVHSLKIIWRNRMILLIVAKFLQSINRYVSHTDTSS